MNDTNAKHHATSLCLLVITLALCLYMLTFRAAIQSGDTLRALDAVTSYARYGDWLMDESSWFKPALIVRDASELPLREYDVEERLNVLLAAPLLKLADALPNLGKLHTVWLFNVFVTAGIVALIFCLVSALNFSPVAGAIVALTAGFGTILWVYSQTFFREPLSAVFVLGALLLIQLGRRSGLPIRLGSLALAAGAFCLAVLTKQSALFGLPALLIFAWPGASDLSRKLARRLACLPLALLAAMILLMLVDPLPAPLQTFFSERGLDLRYAGEALRGYLLSPGGSVWGTSPVVLLAIPGGLMLWRQGRFRLVLTIVTMIACYALGHAVTTGAHWFGGLSWPPRFLLPALPVVMLAAAPLAEHMLSPFRVRLRALWLALLVYGIWIQFSGVSLGWSHYGELLPAESQGLAEWLPSLFQPQYFRWVLLPQLWDSLGFDFLWVRGQLPIWALGFGSLALATLYTLNRLLRQPKSRWKVMSPLLALIALNLILLNLSAAYQRDPRTQSAQVALHEAKDHLTRSAAPGDILLLTSNDYGNFALNHLDSEQPRSIVLARPLAQAASDKQPAQVLSNNPYGWFDLQSLRIIQHVTAKHERLWLLDSTSPFMNWSFRPLERYLALHAYPLGDARLETADDSVRLLEYSAMSQPPDPMSLYFGELPTDLRFGDAIGLRSLDMPRRGPFAPGESVEFSLLWQADEPLSASYTVAAFIADSGTSQPIAQGRDSAPQAGFAPTNAWQAGVPVWDNRAIRLPEDAPAGEYQLWVVMYALDDQTGEILRLPVSGASVTGDGAIGILPVTISIVSDADLSPRSG